MQFNTAPPASDGIVHLSLRPADYPRFLTSDTYVEGTRDRTDGRDFAAWLGCCIPLSSFPSSPFLRLTPQAPPSLPPPNITPDLSGGNVSPPPSWVLPGSLTRPRLGHRTSLPRSSVGMASDPGFTRHPPPTTGLSSSDLSYVNPCANKSTPAPADDAHFPSHHHQPPPSLRSFPPPAPFHRPLVLI